jgi:hypothetical protein
MLIRPFTSNSDPFSSLFAVTFTTGSLLYSILWSNGCSPRIKGERITKISLFAIPPLISDFEFFPYPSFSLAHLNYSICKLWKFTAFSRVNPTRGLSFIEGGISKLISTTCIQKEFRGHISWFEVIDWLCFILFFLDIRWFELVRCLLCGLCCVAKILSDMRYCTVQY